MTCGYWDRGLLRHRGPTWRWGVSYSSIGSVVDLLGTLEQEASPLLRNV